MINMALNLIIVKAINLLYMNFPVKLKHKNMLLLAL